jgi:hypothetical protein
MHIQHLQQERQRFYVEWLPFIDLSAAASTGAYMDHQNLLTSLPEP